jgi:uncharacterized protein (TIGR02217 family)
VTVLTTRLDADIEAGAKAKPRYATDIVTTDGGFEVRNSRWAYPLFQFEFNLAPGVLGTDEPLDDVIEVFHLVGGSAGTFPFRHWADFQGVGEYLGTGNGSTTQFQLVRNYSRGLLTRQRKIVLPDPYSVIARVNGVVTPVTVGDNGLITFGTAPALNAIVTADFTFDCLVRFGDDELEFVALTGELEQPMNVVLYEVKVA